MKKLMPLLIYSFFITQLSLFLYCSYESSISCLGYFLQLKDTILLIVCGDRFRVIVCLYVFWVVLRLAHCILLL